MWYLLSRFYSTRERGREGERERREGLMREKREKRHRHMSTEHRAHRAHRVTVTETDLFKPPTHQHHTAKTVHNIAP